MTAPKKLDGSCCRAFLLHSGSGDSTFGTSLRGHSSVGRAPALQAGCQGFESPCLQSSLAAVAEREDCRARSLDEGGPLRACEGERGELRLGKPLMHYVYILQSDADEQAILYRVDGRFAQASPKPQCRACAAYSQWKPWHLKTYVAFRSRTRASDFEQHLMSASGRAFARKRL